MWNIIDYHFNIYMFAIALGLGPLETITIAISVTVFIGAFTWVSVKGDLRELANELIDNSNNKEEN